MLCTRNVYSVEMGGTCPICQHADVYHAGAPLGSDHCTKCELLELTSPSPYEELGEIDIYGPNLKLLEGDSTRRVTIVACSDGVVRWRE